MVWYGGVWSVLGLCRHSVSIGRLVLVRSLSGLHPATIVSRVRAGNFYDFGEIARRGCVDAFLEMDYCRSGTVSSLYGTHRHLSEGEELHSCTSSVLVG